MAAVPRHEEIEALLERHGPMMAYVVRGILSDPHEQEECLAQVRARVWERWESYDRERSSPATWLTALCRILWGLALCTFRLEVFYLQYLLPLLGATLLYLGYRSLRRENRWFHLGWIMAGIHLAVQMTVLVLGGTPVLDRIGAIPWLNWSLTWALQAVNLLMLLSLRQGSRTAFALLAGGESGEKPPCDWLGRGLTAYAAAIAVALWCELDPCTQPAMLGVSITNRWLYYGRGIAFIALEVYLLWCIAQERDVLSGRGYAIAPAPVRLSGRTVLGLVLAVTVAATIPALWLRYPFQSIQTLGGTQAVQNKGIARTLWTGVQYYP